MKKELIVISCSNRKKKVQGKVSAWDLYDGVIYRVLKKNNFNSEKFDIAIISAKYGLIFPKTKIEYYDQKMTSKRAKELQVEVMHKLRELLKNNYKIIHICLGKNYLACISSMLNDSSKINILHGAIGLKMQKLKDVILKK